MFFKKIQPSRAQAVSDNEIVVDLDKLVAEPVPFKWAGKAHYIKPMELQIFLKTTGALKDFDLMMAKAKQGLIPFEECVDEIHELVSSCCDSIGREEILTMTIAQVNALMYLIVNTVSGNQKKSPPPIAQDSKRNLPTQ